MTAIESVGGYAEAEEAAVRWLEQIVPRIMRGLMGSDNLDSPLLQLPLAQMRLAQALYSETEGGHGAPDGGETMGSLSQRLGARHSALTQAADRLIHNGLAERTSDARDRRIVRLRLTDKGRAWIGERRERRRVRLARLWSLLATEERTAFVQAVNTIEAATVRLSTSDMIVHADSEPETESTARPLVEEMLTHLAVGADLAGSTDVRSTAASTRSSKTTPAMAMDKEGE
jgi:DNA-binding MarR family transcriptional regulator